MSRIGKQNIKIPDKTEVSIDGGKVSVKGPLGEISRDFGGRIGIQKNNEGWIAECENFKGIITGGVNPKVTDEEINLQIKDAIFTAFGIPPYLAKDSLIKKTGEPAVIEEERVFA